MSAPVRRHIKRMAVDVCDGACQLHLGESETWNGADLALLREAFIQLIEREGFRQVALNMQFVKYLPSGFFGLLMDWHHESQVQFTLLAPQPNVQQMLWFQHFFRNSSEGSFDLRRQEREELPGSDSEPEPLLVEDAAN